jgi:peptidoglycan hydrolase-like protein with peptidoglycan-binding domain
MAVKFYGNTIQKGSSHADDVKEWQTFLKSGGYYTGAIDGDFGDMTHNATIEYQKASGLDADGVVGDLTWGKAGYLNRNTPIAPPDATKFSVDNTEGSAYNTASSNKNNAQSKLDSLADFKSTDYYSGLTKTEDGGLMLDKVMQDILNRKEFSYDFNGDALYQQYKDKYTQQGKMAMQDTMGQAAAMTGGYGSSYASTVGNQAYQSSLQNLNDVIPELYQLAYDKYNQEGQDLYNQYGLLSNEYDNAYGKYNDEYNKTYSERDYWGNEENNIYNREYVTHRDNIEDERYNAEFNEALRQYEQSLALGKEAAASGANGEEFHQATYRRTLDNGNVIWEINGKEVEVEKGVNPYTGTKNTDAKNGTFSNGYQPNNVGGDKLSPTGHFTYVNGVKQNVWETPDGERWVWDGTENKYINEKDIEYED